MKLDCHTHTSRFSGCSVIAPDNLLTRARGHGLDGLVLTEHNQFWPRNELSSLRRAFPELLILSGAEITVGLHHVVVLLPRPDRSLISIENMASLAAAVEKRNGCAFVAHPFRFTPDFDELVLDYPFRAIEVASFNQSKAGKVESSLEYARQHDLHPITASDAHSAEPVGEYFITLPETISSAADLIDIIQTGNFNLQAPGLAGNSNQRPY